MDKTESIALQHLEHRFPGTNRVVYEPDGNVPPDFLVDGQVAVEVRRLNEHDWAIPRPRGLEEAERPLTRQLRTLINSPVRSGNSTRSVIAHFGRPLAGKEAVASGVAAFLDELQGVDDPESEWREVAPRLHLKCTGEVTPRGHSFVYGGGWDDNQGGFVLGLVARNVSICLERKSEKVGPHRHKYSEWWLLLVDYVSYGASDYADSRLREALDISHDWDCVLLVDPLDVTATFQL